MHIAPDLRRLNALRIKQQHRNKKNMVKLITNQQMGYASPLSPDLYLDGFGLVGYGGFGKFMEWKFELPYPLYIYICRVV